MKCKYCGQEIVTYKKLDLTGKKYLIEKYANETTLKVIAKLSGILFCSQCSEECSEEDRRK